MKKQVLCFLLAAALTVSAGCGTGGGSTESGTAGKTTSGASEASSESGPQKYNDVKLKMLVCWNGGYKTPKDQYNNEVAKKIREKTGVTVTYEGIMMAENEKLNLLFASGDMPDMVNAPYWGGTDGCTQIIKKAAAQGRLLPIEKLAPQYPNLKNAYDVGIVSQSYLDNDLDDPTFKGHRYVLPQETPGDEADITNWAYGVFVRGDVPKALNVDPTSIKTSDQLYDFMVKARDHKFKDVNGNDCIVATTYHSGWDYGGYAQSFNAKQLTDYVKLPDGSYTYGVLTDNWINKNLFIWKLVNNNILDKECFKQTDSQADEKVGNGTALFASTQYGCVVNSTKLTGLYTSHPEMRYVPVGPLNYSDGSAAVQGETYGRSGSPVIFFPTSCANVGAALTYLDYVNSEEGARLVQYGIEGETYTMNDKNQPRLNADILKRKKAGDTAVDNELREKGIGYIFGRTFQANKSVTWWGEANPGDADAAVPDVEAYKKLKPVERMKGYPLSALAPTYKDYDAVTKFAFEGTKQDDYTQRAFFAKTESEAKSILKSYQDYLLTQQNGMFKDYLKYLTEQAKSRSDVVN